MQHRNAKPMAATNRTHFTLGTGFKSDEVAYFLESANATATNACRQMLNNWLEDEEAGSCLEDLAYIMEGLKMIAATDCLKRYLEPVDKMEDISE